jgi:hypothetical protein
MAYLSPLVLFTLVASFGRRLGLEAPLTSSTFADFPPASSPLVPCAQIATNRTQRNKLGIFAFE